MSPVPEVGQLVDVRHRRFVVTEVRPSSVSSTGRALPPTLVTLSSVEDEGTGDELQVIWEVEPGAFTLDRATLPEMTGIDPPARLAAFLDAVRWGATASADRSELHAPFRSGITIEDYQLDPVVRALQMPRVNLLIADDVGLGKTIEAGLVVQELLLRHRARTVLVVCPAGLQIQWRDQLRDKFGLEFRVVDSELRRELRRRRGLHVNPWSHFPRLITSIDFLKRDRPLRLFRELLPAEGESAFPRRFDLLIVDEAHNVAPSGTGRYALDSQRTAAIRALAPHFEHKLFLSATPHNGYKESFSSLLELLDNQRFHRRLDPDPIQLQAIMVRRLKDELPPRWDGSRRFARRQVAPLVVAWSEAERQAHQDLRTYADRRLQGATDPGERVACEFVLKLLKKRLFSSPQAFLSTLRVHRDGLTRGRKGAERSRTPTQILKRRLEGVDEEFGDDNAYEEETRKALSLTAALFRPLDATERTALDRLEQWGRDASGRPDSKAAALLRWLGSIVRPDGAWSRERVILFTEYRATQRWLQGLLVAAGLGGEGRLLTLFGGMPTDEREAIKAAFQASPEDAAVRILLATDAASEGIDLQNHCHRLVHYEIPWNPNRLEQRNGRIDRHGQRAPEVLVYHFVGEGFQATRLGHKPGDLDGDLEFLAHAALKVEAIRQDLGSVGPVIAAQVTEAMLGQRENLDTTRAEAAAAPARRLLKLERDLKAEVQRLHEQLEDSRRDLRLTPAHIQTVVQTGLDLAGQPPLIEREPGVFQVPAMRGAWARVGEGLAHPHTHAIRPIVFDHALAEGRDDRVLAHLNHRLVQMCLHLLRAAVWSPEGKDGLHRVTTRLVPGGALTEPVLLAHARLVVLGADHTRLHEELISAGGRIREGRFARLGVQDLARALDAASDRPAPQALNSRLFALWKDTRDPLMAALEARVKDRTDGLRKRLADRAEDDAQRLTEVLTELKRAIEAEFKQTVDPQVQLFSPPEVEQYQRNRDALLARAAAIPDEITREVDAIRRRYQEPVARMFPVAVTWLVPEGLR